MKVLIPILLISIIIGCKKKNVVINNLNNNKIEIMGHAGMGFSSLYPINTAESILRCLNEDADGTEIDVQLTKDNVLVAFHNSTLDENTNFSGKIRDYTWNELKEACYTSTPQLNYKILKIRDLFDGIGDLENYTFTLDVKIYPIDGNYFVYVDDFTDALASLYSDYQIDNNIFVESQDDNFLNELYAKDTQIGLYIYPQSFEEGFNTAIDLGLRGISIDNDLITKEQVDLAHTYEIFVTIWGVSNSSGNLDAANKSPDMIQTDDIDDLVKLLR